MKTFIVLFSVAFLSLTSGAFAGATVAGDYTGWAAEAMDAGNGCGR